MPRPILNINSDEEIDQSTSLINEDNEDRDTMKSNATGRKNLTRSNHFTQLREPLIETLTVY